MKQNPETDPLIRYVAILDILGFKNKLRSHGAATIRDLYASARDITYEEKIRVKKIQAALTCADLKTVLLEEMKEGPAIELAQGPIKKRAYPKIEHLTIFSDSLFVFAQDAELDSLEQITKFSNFVFQEFLLAGLPLRGAVALGEVVVWAEKNIFLGQGIVTAYELEQSLDIVGIVVQDDGQAATPFLSEQLPIPLSCGDVKQLKVPLGPVFESIELIENVVKSFKQAMAEADSDGDCKKFAHSEQFLSLMVKGKAPSNN